MQTITPEVLTILKRSRINGLSLHLPEEQLSRDLYLKVAKVIANAGGKWNKSAKAHTFTSDPSELLGLAIKTGKTESKKQKLQQFFTPPELAAHVVAMAEVSGKKVLEPSAGHGALANECIAQGAKSVHCVELDHQNVLVLKERHDRVFETDFLTQVQSADYDRVVMNPPFTKNQDIRHVSHAMGFLKSGGRLVAIMAANTDRPFFSMPGINVEPLPEGSFKQSGTGVNTVLVTYNKP